EALLGLRARLVVVNRWRAAVMVAGLAPLLLSEIRHKPKRALAVMAASAALVVGTQLLAWRIQFGRARRVPQGGTYMTWTHPHLRELLLSPYHGLLPWSPVFALGLLALPLAWRALPRGRPLLGGLLRAGGGGSSYGARRLASLTPVAALGLGPLLDRLRKLIRPLLQRVILAAALGFSIFTASAYLSRMDDLALALTGRPSADNPDPHATGGWTLRWGPAYFLKPGVTFSDAPGNRGRLVGLLAGCVVVAGATAAWRVLERRPAAQAALGGAGLLWVAFVLGWV